MTSARDAIHKALAAQLPAVAGVPVRVTPTAQLPYVRLEGDSETESGAGRTKTGGPTVVRPLVAVFSEDFGQARTVATSIINFVLSGALAPAGFVVQDVRLDLAQSVPEEHETRTIHGERIGFILTVSPS